MIALMKRAAVDAAIIVAVIALWASTRKPEPHAAVQEAVPAKAIAKESPEPIHPKVVQAYPAKVKQKVSLPPAMQENQNIAVLDSSVVAPSENGQTVTTTLDVDTGKVETLVAKNPAPWFAGESTGEVRLSYGIKNGFRKAARLSANEDVFQIKSVHFGVTGSLDTDGAYFAGMGVAYRW